MANSIFNLSTLNGSNGFALNGINNNDRSGFSVSSAGDINGDGIADLIIGAPFADPNNEDNAGQSYVVFGSRSGFSASLNLSSLNGSNGFALNGFNVTTAGSFIGGSGFSVSSAGDINGDGIADLIIGAPRANDVAGQSYVVFGSRSGFSASLNLSTLNGSDGFALNSINASDQSGNSLSSAGDINGDGIADLIIGARYADPNNKRNAGQSYVVFGSRSGFSASLNLSTLNGSNGFALNGINGYDLSGNSVSSAGDINGDGIADLIIGAYLADPNSQNNAGQSYVVFGSRSTFGASLNLSTLNGSNGFTLNGISGQSGFSVSSAGDINGDSIADLIIGAAFANGFAGQSYVVFGSRSGFSASLNLSTLNGSNGFALNGINASDRSGRSVSNAGDINGDGIADLIIGAYLADPNSQNNAGQSYVVFGSRSTFGASLNLSTLNGSNGFTLNGISQDDFSGRSVSSAGDINGDGIADLIIGARYADPNGQTNAGQSYVVFGNAPSVLDLNGNANGINFATTFRGTPIRLVATDLSLVDASSATLAGATITITNPFDGAAEVLSATTTGTGISATYTNGVLTLSGTDTVANYQQVLRTIDYNNTAFAPQVGSRTIEFVVNDGNSFANISQVATTTVAMNVNAAPILDLNGSNGLVPGFALNGINMEDVSGWSVSSAGDINGDGIADLIIGAIGANGFAGRSYVVFGSRSGFSASLNLSSLNGSNGFALNGINGSDNSGRSVSSAGDINGDGITDLIIGARGANGSAGQSYVVFGSRSGFSASLNLSTLNGSNGFALNGINSNDRSGNSVSSAGDINGDGIADLIIGAYDANGKAGQSYVVFGSRSGFSASLNLSTLNGSNGFALNGINSNDRSGRSVSSAGDINGDGIADLIIGAIGANGLAGQSYVVFGSRSGFSASLNLSSLNGSNGFALNGINSNDNLGRSVSSAGDINGDGIADLIIGAVGASKSYVVFGSRSGFSASLNLSSLNGSNGFALNGITRGDNSGRSVSSAGDINGDGIADLIIGAAFANGLAGQSYVVFGSRSGFSASLNLSTLNGSNGFALNGINRSDNSGNSVSSAGDINGDGIADLIIGAYGADPNGKSNAGQSYVVLGHAGIGASGTLALAQLSGSATDGINFSTTFNGTAIAVVDTDLTLVDANSPNLVGATITITNLQDGAAETLSATTTGTSITANYTNGVLTLSGSDTLANYQQVLRTINYNNNKAFTPPAGLRTIEFVVNDGSSFNNLSKVATTTVAMNVNAAPILDLNGSNGLVPGFALNGINGSDQSGISVSSAGDINGDGITDLIIGAIGANGLAGQSYVVFGSRSGFSASLNLSALNGSNGFALNGINGLDRSGTSVRSTGDINGDGIADLIIGAFGANGLAGRSYVVFGSRSGFSASLNLSTLNGSNGFALNGINSNDFSGISVSSAGDINGDGIADLIIGAPFANGSAGRSYVVFGSRSGFSASLNLSTLNGSNGFTLNGIIASDRSGSSVSSAGDINGDGIADLIIGAPFANGYAGQSYVVFGSRSGFSASLNLSTLNGSNGFALNGINGGDLSGTSVSSAGDINGDGIADLIIGAPNGNGYEEQSYVVFGSRSGFSASLDLASLNGSNGFALNGISKGDRLGSSVSSAGDINGDGIADLIIGSFNADPNGQTNAGQSYVVFGSRSGFSASLNLSTLNGSNGFALNGINGYDRSGYSVNSAGDINGDGIADLIIGAKDANGFAGKSYVVLGHAGIGASGTLALAQLSGSATDGINFSTTFNGTAIAVVDTDLTLVDANSPNLVGATITITNLQDGAAETLSATTTGTSITANYTNGVLTLSGSDTLANYQQVLRTINYNNNKAFTPPAGLRTIEFVVNDGSSFNNLSKVATTTVAMNVNAAPILDLNGSNGLVPGFALNGINRSDQSGRSVSSAGDINGDGINDLIIGAYAADPNGKSDAGQSYVVFGSRSGFSASLNLSSLNGSNGFTLNGISQDDRSGNSVSSAGDINGDGIADLIIGAPAANPNGKSDAGQSYVVFGSRSGFSASLNLSSLNGSNGFALNGINGYDRSGNSVSSAGDINGDGIADLIIGARTADPNGQDSAGQSYVVFGSRSGFSASLNLSSLNGSNGFALNGLNTNDYSGRSVSSAGDINGDGIADLIIGASSADPNGKTNAGQSYVVFGSRSGFSASLNLSTLNGSNGFALNGINLNDFSGTSVSSAGDINGDGIADLIIGASGADPNGQSNAGQSYVVFGSRSGFSASLNLSTLNGSNGFALNGINGGDISGISVSSAGDINGDGIADLIIGAPFANGSAGQSYVVLGHAGIGASGTLALAQLSGSATDGINFSTTFKGTAIAVVDTDLTLVDANSPNLVGATITITNLQDGAAETLSATTTDTSITADYINGVLTLSGTDTVANYQKVLRTITYSNTAAAANPTARSITFVVKDGQSINNTSAVATTTLTMDVNAAPVNTIPAAQTVNEDTQIAITGISVNDTNGNLATTQLTVTNGTLNITLNGATISNGANDSNTLTLSGTQTQINDTLATLKYQGNLNFNGDDTLTILSTDSASTPLSDKDTVNITVNPVNDAPTLAAVTAGSLTDTAANDSFSAITGTLAGADVDSKTLTYGITGGTVESGISTLVGTYGTLTVNTATGAYSYAPVDAAINALSANASDNFTFTVSDGTLSTSQAFAVSITGVNDTPALTAVTAGSYIDTAANDTFSNITGTLAGSDRDTGTVLTYGITGGIVANGTSTLAGTYGSLSLNTSTGAYTYTPNNAAINALSSNASDNFTFTVNDGTATVDQSFAINITGANGTPILAAVTAGSYTDTATNDTFSNITGTLVGSDRDTSTVLTYGITSGTVANGTSSLAGTYGRLSVDTSTGAYSYTPNNEAINALSSNASDNFTFTVSDGTATVDQSFAINITGVNDTPILAAVTAGSYTDTAANDTFSNITGALAGGDRDTSTVLTYGITGGTVANGTSTLAGTYGSLSLNTLTGAYTYTPNASAINALSNNSSDNFTFTVSDGTATVDQSFVINITGANDTPSLTAVTAGSYTDTATNDTFSNITGTLAGSDRDTSAVLTYGITGGIAANGISTLAGTYGSLSLNTSTGAYTYTPNASAINALSNNATDNFTFTVSDGTLTVDQSFAININGANDTPALTAVTAGSYTDTTANDTFNNITGTLSGSDQDTSAVLTYGITNGTVANGTSTLDGTYGSLSLNITTGAYTYTPKNAAINALSNNASDSFTFTVSDGTATVNQSFAINITGANDTPILTAVTAGSYTDTTANDAFSNITGTLAGSDHDTGTVLAYGITNGTVANGTSTLAGTYGSLSVDTSTGAYIYTPNASAINALSNNATDNFTFTVNDGTATVNQSFAINITGVNDTPAQIVISNNQIPENVPINTIVGKFTSTDRDTNDSTTYSLTVGDASTDNDKFEIIGDQLIIKNSPDFETKASYAIRVKVTDKGGLSSEQTFTINITDIDEPPTQLIIDNNQISENSAIDTIIGKLTANSEKGDILTYSLVDGADSTDNQFFAIVDNTLRNKVSPDFENKPNYKVQIKATNQKGLSTEKPFTINITDVNEAPTQLVIDTTQILENSPANTIVGTIIGTDLDAGDNLTYSLIPIQDATNFAIDGNQLKIATSPDFETKSSYQIQLKATDKAGLSIEKPFTINITDVKEPTILKNNGDGIFQVTGDQGTKVFNFQFTTQKQQQWTEAGFFKVDDNLGTINGLKPTDAGYLSAALDRFQLISSQIPTANLPQGFDGKTNRSINFNYGDNVRFGIVTDFSIDQLRQNKSLLNNLTLSDSNNLKTTLTNNGELALNWQSPLNLSLTSKLGDDSTLPLGTATQYSPQGEFFDFRNSTTNVKATFSIYREAAYNNSIYFYAIQDESGAILDSLSQKVLKPTDPGYLQAALRNAVSDVNLSTPNQTVNTVTTTLTKGSIYASVIVINSDKSALLDNNPNNDPAAYTSFILGNADKVDHIRLLGDNTFGYEDLAGGGDLDYNDMIVKAIFQPTTL
jgi:hypothetical protein